MTSTNVSDHEVSVPPVSDESMADGNKTCDDSRSFMCGVVEGFYGRPWTAEQRKELFEKLQRWGLNSYLYAPKDDYKHRAYWRDLYTVEEAGHLSSLISTAHQHNVTFIYGLSPGVDITYSSQKELAALRRKLDQVATFGCRAFALLFDDIDSEMHEEDKRVFQSFAHAQVTVTNEMNEQLGVPSVFLFCPTQYCASRALPSVSTSDYLTTIGSKLAANIDVMWTGPRVVSKVMSVESIEELSAVLKRPPVIWDNLHANDYDQKRLYMGPYSGRSVQLKSHIRGVMTNPNCEFGVNFVAIRTLSLWCQATEDAPSHHRDSNDSVSADIRLETEGDGKSMPDVPAASSCPADVGAPVTTTSTSTTSPPQPGAGVYHPRHALCTALAEWLPEFSRVRAAPSVISKRPLSVPTAGTTSVVDSVCASVTVCCVNTCMVTTAPTVTTSEAATMVTAVPIACQTGVVCSTVVPAIFTQTVVVGGGGMVEPVSTAVLNSLADDSNIVVPCTSTCVHTTSPTTTATATANSDDVNVVSPTPEGAIVSTTDDEPMEDGGGVTGGVTGGVSPCVATASCAPLSSPADTHTDNDKDCESVETTAGTAAAVLAPVLVEPMSVESELDSNTHRTHNNNNNNTVSNDSTLPQPTNTATTDTLSKNTDDPVSCMTIMTSSCSDSPAMSVEEALGSECDVTVTSAALAVDDLSVSDLLMMVDLFYLPFEHGEAGVALLHDFQWLKTNNHVVAPLVSQRQRTPDMPLPPEVIEWHERAEKFNKATARVTRLLKRLFMCENRSLLYDIYAYMWDVECVLSQLNGYVKWLVLGCSSSQSPSYVVGNYTWFTRGWKESFTSGDSEPWVFRGGLTGDLERLLPVDHAADLLVKSPEHPLAHVYVIRPYRACSDEAAVARLWQQATPDSHHSFLQYPQLSVDRWVSAYLLFEPERCLLLENDSGEPVGFVATTPDAVQLMRKIRMSWLHELRDKYPSPVAQPDSSALSPAEECIVSLHGDSWLQEPSRQLLEQYPGSVRFAVASDSADCSLTRRLLACALATLRASGCFGAHCCTRSSHATGRHQLTAATFVQSEMSADSQLVFYGRNC